MRKIIAGALVLLSLASLPACQSITALENAAGTVAGVKVKGKTAYIAISAFNASEKLVTAYLVLPLCNGTVTLCRKLGAAEALDQPFNAGIVARNQLRAYMRANPGTLADAGLYNNLIAASSGLKQVMAVYGIGGN
jgi:hypothetical protein